MSFDGVIESFGRETITGWASFSLDGQAVAPQLRLHFNTRGVMEPTEMTPRGGGMTTFTFRLPSEFQRMGWHAFLDEFDAIIAEFPAKPDAGQFRIPFFKSVFSAFDADNRTALKANRLRDYSLDAKPGGRIAVFTIVYNEHVVLPLWARYYAAQFGAENLFVIDQGSSEPAYADSLPKGVNIVRVPRDVFDNWLIARQVALFQRFLLEAYDSVLYTDSDEFVCVDPAVLDGRTLSEFLRALPETVGITKGFNLVHDLASEPAYDPARPLLQQRKYLHRMPMMDKPLISRIPLNWVAGFHQAAEGGVEIPGLYMLHLRWFDLDFALRKGGFYRASAWNQYDVEHKLADYQRDGEQEIINRFKSLAAEATAVAGASFDPSKNFTLVPEWMRAAVNV